MIDKQRWKRKFLAVCQCDKLGYVNWKSFRGALKEAGLRRKYASHLTTKQLSRTYLRWEDCGNCDGHTLLPANVTVLVVGKKKPQSPRICHNQLVTFLLDKYVDHCQQLLHKLLSLFSVTNLSRSGNKSQHLQQWTLWCMFRFPMAQVLMSLLFSKGLN